MLLPKPTVWRSEKYRRYVASLPCCRCHAPQSNAHHEQFHGGTMGGKVSDEYCIPLCPRCHTLRHTAGRGMWLLAKLDPEEVIQRTQEEWVGRGNERGWTNEV
jgi:hypothetical protein